MWIGIDGEGQGRNPHKYTLLVAASEEGSYSKFVQNETGLSTEACLKFICSIPNKQAYAFAFGYDLTKILADLDDQSLYCLMRPELRPSGIEGRPPIPIKWGEFRLNLQGTKFTVKYRGATTIIWDVFKFFQCKFTQALQDWKVLESEAIERMEEMKNKRGLFENESKQAIYEYCISECRAMATLARKLTVAHTEAQLTLKNYFGAGSTGAAILDDMGIKENIIRHVPYGEGKDSHFQISMRDAIMSAFFGGRFENSIMGPVRHDIYSPDISSAYPYQLAFMPCLEHGTWVHTTDRKEIENSKAALIHWHLSPLLPGNRKRWGPFPFRLHDGSIIFPVEGGNGWVWKDEYLAGEKLFKNVRFISAWILKSECDCKPFPKMGHYYRERVRIGKSGAGIVFKLGPNSCYGKLAQSVGNPQYQCWVWAGMITSGCRAQILNSMSELSDINNVLAIATDGYYSLEKPPSITPKDTGTWQTGKPLGGWEISEVKGGMFFARPGINFPTIFGDSTSLEKIRGRGFGRKSVFDNRARIVRVWENWMQKVDLKIDGGEYPIVEFPNVVRFVGAKSSTRRKLNETKEGYIYSRDANYGEWKEAGMVMSFNPQPKRPRVNITKGGEGSYTLSTWSLPLEALSSPYRGGEGAEEGEVSNLYKLIRSEQPDWYTFLED